MAGAGLGERQHVPTSQVCSNPRGWPGEVTLRSTFNPDTTEIYGNWNRWSFGSRAILELGDREEVKKERQVALRCPVSPHQL